MSQFCMECGAQLEPSAGFCGSCGTPAPVTETHADVVKGQEISSPFRYLVASIQGGISAVGKLVKNPKQLIPMMILGGLWLILSLLSAFGINPQPVRVLSFLTFAQGGMYNGMVGAIGGIIGKAIFAYFVSALILPIFSRENPFKGMGRGLKSFLTGLVVKSTHQAGLLVVGMGLALIMFNFLTGNASAVNSMAGVVGVVLALRALWSGNGFLWGFLLSVTNKLSKGKTPTHLTVSRVLSGYAVGSAAGVALSTFQLPYLPYILGAVLLIVGVTLGIAGKPRKEVVSS